MTSEGAAILGDRERYEMLRERPRQRWGEAPDAPGTPLGRLGPLLARPQTLPGRLGERSGRVFRTSFTKTLSERLAERFSSDVALCASCRATAPMCTKPQFYWVRSTIGACSLRLRAYVGDRKNSRFGLENRVLALRNDARASPERAKIAAKSVRTTKTREGEPKIGGESDR